jgi:molybdenum cofactor guanylyltransferase
VGGLHKAGGNGSNCFMVRGYRTIIISPMLSVVIQAGGQSSRMGQDKALKLFLDHPLIQRVIERLQPIADELLVTTNRPEDYAFLNLPLFTDIKPGRGPLGGLYTALFSAKHSIVAVAACDMPFVNVELLKAASEIMVKEETDVVIAKTSKGYEPLHAVYRREACIPAIEAAIASDKWRMDSWFSQVKIRLLTPKEIDRYDPDGLAFFNINTLEDFAQAEQRARE